MTLITGNKALYKLLTQTGGATGEVTSVNGKKGAVVLTNSDVGLPNVTNDAQLKRSAGDFDSFANKSTPIANDIILIEDSANNNSKAKTTLTNLPISTATQNVLNLKANANDVYTKTEVDSSLNSKEDTSNKNQASGYVGLDSNSKINESQIGIDRLLEAGNNVTLTPNGNKIRIESTGGGSNSSSWGSITGDIENQTDLKTALDGKINKIINTSSQDAIALINNQDSGISKNFLTSTISSLNSNKMEKVIGAIDDNLIIFGNNGQGIDGQISVSNLVVTWVENGQFYRQNQIFIYNGKSYKILSNFISNSNVSIENLLLASIIQDITDNNTWGSITGTLANQTDLQTALDRKADKIKLDSIASRTFNNWISNGSEYLAGQIISNNLTNETVIVLESFTSNAGDTLQSLALSGKVSYYPLGSKNPIVKNENPNENPLYNNANYYGIGSQILFEDELWIYVGEDASGIPQWDLKDNTIEVSSRSSLTDEYQDGAIISVMNAIGLPNADYELDPIPSNIFVKSYKANYIIDDTKPLFQITDNNGNVINELKLRFLSSAENPIENDSDLVLSQTIHGLNDQKSLNLLQEQRITNIESDKENTIVAGTTSQYYRGDKTWQELNLESISNTNIIDPVKQDLIWYDDVNSKWVNVSRNKLRDKFGVWSKIKILPFNNLNIEQDIPLEIVEGSGQVTLENNIITLPSDKKYKIYYSVKCEGLTGDQNAIFNFRYNDNSFTYLPELYLSANFNSSSSFYSFDTIESPSNKIKLGFLVQNYSQVIGIDGNSTTSATSNATSADGSIVAVMVSWQSRVNILKKKNNFAYNTKDSISSVPGKYIAISNDGTLIAVGRPDPAFGTTTGNGEVRIIKASTANQDINFVGQPVKLISSYLGFGNFVKFLNNEKLFIGDTLGNLFVYQYNSVNDAWEIAETINMEGNIDSKSNPISGDGNIIVKCINNSNDIKVCEKNTNGNITENVIFQNASNKLCVSKDGSRVAFYIPTTQKIAIYKRQNLGVWSLEKDFDCSQNIYGSPEVITFSGNGLNLLYTDAPIPTLPSSVCVRKFTNNPATNWNDEIVLRPAGGTVNSTMIGMGLSCSDNASSIVATGTKTFVFYLQENQGVSISDSDECVIYIEEDSIENRNEQEYVNAKLAEKENVIPKGEISQYYRGDKTWTNLDKASVGLSSVDNTSDLSKPISTATQSALDLKEDISKKNQAGGYVGLDSDFKIDPFNIGLERILEAGENITLTQNGDKIRIESIITEGLSAEITVESADEIGTIKTYYGSIAPNGYLMLDGGTYLKENYQALWNFAVDNNLDTTDVSHTALFYHTGESDLNFRVPDFRGYFLRGLGGIDSGRTLGSVQMDDFKEHNHYSPFMNEMPNFNTTIPSPGLSRDLNWKGIDYVSSGAADSLADGSERVFCTSNVGGTETRPKNIAVNYIIKYTETPNNTFLGGLTYKGLWNAEANIPAMPVANSKNGYYYKVSVNGTTSVDGISSWKVGDWIVYNGTTWDKVDNTESVTSVNGKVGAVSITKSDVGLDQVNNTSDANKPISIATQNALDLKVDKNAFANLSSGGLQTIAEYIKNNKQNSVTLYTDKMLSYDVESQTFSENGNGNIPDDNLTKGMPLLYKYEFLLTDETKTDDVNFDLPILWSKDVNVNIEVDGSLIQDSIGNILNFNTDEAVGNYFNGDILEIRNSERSLRNILVRHKAFNNSPESSEDNGSVWKFRSLRSGESLRLYYDNNLKTYRII